MSHVAVKRWPSPLSSCDLSGRVPCAVRSTPPFRAQPHSSLSLCLLDLGPFASIRALPVRRSALASAIRSICRRSDYPDSSSGRLSGSSEPTDELRIVLLRPHPFVSFPHIRPRHGSGRCRAAMAAPVWDGAISLPVVAPRWATPMLGEGLGSRHTLHVVYNGCATWGLRSCRAPTDCAAWPTCIDRRSTSTSFGGLPRFRRLRARLGLARWG